MSENTQWEADEPSSGNPGFSLLSIARTAWKRKVCIISVWILSSLGAVAVVRRLPAVYMAQSLVLVESQKIPEKFVSSTVASDLDDRMSAIREQLLSSGELKKIIRDFGLYQKERKTSFEEEILDRMRQDITIELVAVDSNQKKPGSFRIGYQGPDPTIVANVANRLADLYVEQNMRTSVDQAEGTSGFLDTHVEEAKKHLDELEARVSAYKLAHNGELPQQEASLSSALAGLHTRLQANMDAINRAQQTKIIQQSTLDALEASMAAQARALTPAGRAEASEATGLTGIAPRKQSEILQEQLYQLLGRQTEKNPDVIQLRIALEAAKHDEEREQARQQARQLPPTPKGEKPLVAPDRPETPELARAREQVAGLIAQIKAADAEIANRTAEQQRIEHDIDQYQRHIELLPLREQEMAQITRDYEISKDNYKSLLDKQTAAAMSLDMERRQQSERFTVLDRAKAPEKPAKPKRPMLYGAGVGAGLALGFLAGFILELRRNVFLGEWELPEGTTVLARLPYIEVPMQASATTSRSIG
jgi:polysaccharide chain length determinant protein (PEP-CTERM system associated)